MGCSFVKLSDTDDCEIAEKDLQRQYFMDFQGDQPNLR